MILLDTDHCSVLFDQRHRQHSQLVTRLADSFQEIGLPIVALQEQLRGFLAYLHRERDLHKLVWPYHRLAAFLRAMAEVDIVDFTTEAAKQVESLRKQRIRIGTQDLKIAAIALSTESLLLSANHRDFSLVQGLHVENWLD